MPPLEPNLPAKLRFGRFPITDVTPVVEGGEFPAKAVINARIFDTTVLAWDVATACGVAHGIDEVQAGYVLRVARALVPAVRQNNPARFRQPADPDDGRPLVEQMISATGRDPHWQPL